MGLGSFAGSYNFLYHKLLEKSEENYIGISRYITLKVAIIYLLKMMLDEQF